MNACGCYLLEDDVDTFTETAGVSSCQHGDGGFFTAHRVIGRSAIFTHDIVKILRVFLYSIV